MFPVLMALQEPEGITFSRVLHDIPHDFAAVVGYLVLGVFVLFIWMGFRTSRKTEDRGSGTK